MPVRPWAFAPAETDDDEPIVFHRDLRINLRLHQNAPAAASMPTLRALRRAMGHFPGPGDDGGVRARPTPTRFAATFASAVYAHATARESLLDRRVGALSSMSQDMMNSGDALLDRWFNSERLKAALAWFGAQSGPPTDLPGFAPMVGFAASDATSRPDARRRQRRAHHSAVRRTRRRRREAGHRLPATALRRRGDDWEVVDTSGTVTTARHVIAACHIGATLDLLAAAGGHRADQIDRWRRAIVVGNGIGIAVRLGTTALPAYRNTRAACPPTACTAGWGC